MRTILVGLALLSCVACASRTRGVMDTVSILGEHEELSPSGRDRLRLREMDKIQKALEGFYKANKRYPATWRMGPEGEPFWWQEPDYLDGDPPFYSFHARLWIWVTPQDGGCSYDQNRYFYTQTNGGLSYTVAFCLGTAVRRYTAGVHTLTPKGIQ